MSIIEEDKLELYILENRLTLTDDEFEAALSNYKNAIIDTEEGLHLYN